MSLYIYDCRVILDNNNLKVYKDDKEVLTADYFSTIHMWLYNVNDMSIHFATTSNIEIPYCSMFEIIGMSIGVANIDVKKLAERERNNKKA